MGSKATQRSFSKISVLEELSEDKKERHLFERESNIFVTNCSKLFDIIGASDRIKGKELLWGVKMTDADWQLYKNMSFTTNWLL